MTSPATFRTDLVSTLRSFGTTVGDPRFWRSRWASAPRSTRVGFAFWLAAVGLAFWAQRLYTPLRHFTQARAFYGIAALVGLCGILLIERQAPVPQPEFAAITLQPWRWRSRREIASAVLVGLGVIGALSTIYLLGKLQAYRFAFWIWVGALIAVLAGAALGVRRPIGFARRPTRAETLEMLAVLGILVLALWLRLPNLETIPPRIFEDEGQTGLEARRILRGQVQNMFWLGWAGLTYLNYGIQSLGLRVFGDNLFGLRMASTVQGLISLLLLYLIVRRLFGVRPALVAAFLLAVSHFQIHYSRDGANFMSGLLFTLLVFYFLLRALDTRSAVDFVLAGIAIGLCLVVYYAARYAIVIAGLYLLQRAARERAFLRRHWLGFLAIGAGTLVTLAPMVVVFSRYPETLLWRSREVFIFTPGVMNHAKYTYGVDRVEDVIKQQVQRSLEAFNRGPDGSPQYNYGGPLVDFWTSALLVLGTAAFSFRLLRPRYLLLGSWFWLTVVSSILTADPPSSPHLIGVLPVLMIFPALVVDAGWRASKQVFGQAGTYAFGLFVAVFLVLALIVNYRGYFKMHIKSRPADTQTLLGRYLAGIRHRYRPYLIGGSVMSPEYPVVAFLSPDLDAVSLRDRPPHVPVENVPADRGLAFVIERASPIHDETLNRIRQVYPGGKEALHRSTTGVPQFTSYLVEPEAVARANR